MNSDPVQQVEAIKAIKKEFVLAHRLSVVGVSLDIQIGDAVVCDGKTLFINATSSRLAKAYADSKGWTEAEAGAFSNVAEFAYRNIVACDYAVGLWDNANYIRVSNLWAVVPSMGDVYTRYLEMSRGQ